MDRVVRERLRNQRIDVPIRGTPADVVRWLGAVQSQDFGGAKWSVGLRLSAATDADVEKAFDRGDILRTHLLRPTWHFIVPEDIRWMLALTAPRVHQQNAGRARQLGLTPATFAKSNRVIESALSTGRHLTRLELEAALNDAGIETEFDQRLAYLVMHAELEGVVCSGPRRGKQFTYALLEERAPPAKALSRADALAELARRFYTSRGPATPHDFAKWSGLTVTDARKAVDLVRDELRESPGPKGPSYSGADALRGTAKRHRAHLVAIYDEYVAGYRDHSAVISKLYAARIVELGNAAFNVMVLDGLTMGTWRRELSKGSIKFELNPFRRLTRAEGAAFDSAAARYAAFLGLALA